MSACWIAIGAVLFAFGCGDDASVNVTGRSGGIPGDGAVSGKLTLTGSSTMAPLVGEIGKRFEAAHPGVRIDVQTGGSSQGIADTHRGLADIGMSSRALNASERDGVTTHVLAQDGVAFIVHADNPIVELNNAELLAIYTGKVSDWSEVGGAGGRSGEGGAVTVINRAEGRSELELVTKFFGVKPSDLRPTLVAGENQECVKLVAGNRNAIAYLSVGTAEYEVQRGTKLKLLPFDGIEATTATVKAGTFPLGRPLVMITREAPSPLVEAFIAFALSSAVDDLIEGQSFVAPR